MPKGQGFDRWAEGYDASVGRSDEEGKLSLYSRIHEKQENRLVFIAPTARWILMRRTNAQSAAVPMKISYFNAY